MGAGSGFREILAISSLPAVLTLACALAGNADWSGAWVPGSDNPALIERAWLRAGAAGPFGLGLAALLAVATARRIRSVSGWTSWETARAAVAVLAGGGLTAWLLYPRPGVGLQEVASVAAVCTILPAACLVGGPCLCFPALRQPKALHPGWFAAWLLLAVAAGGIVMAGPFLALLEEHGLGHRGPGMQILAAGADWLLGAGAAAWYAVRVIVPQTQPPADGGTPE